MKQKYEYDYRCDGSKKCLLEKINNDAKQGWELVNVVYCTDNVQWEAWMKREIG
jgi:hypothetical protein